MAMHFKSIMRLQNSWVEVWQSPKNTPKVALLFHWLRLLQSLEVVKSFQTKVCPLWSKLFQRISGLSMGFTSSDCPNFVGSARAFAPSKTAYSASD